MRIPTRMLMQPEKVQPVIIKPKPAVRKRTKEFDLLIDAFIAGFLFLVIGSTYFENLLNELLTISDVPSKKDRIKFKGLQLLLIMSLFILIKIIFS
jgi:hypothetical protein